MHNYTLIGGFAFNTKPLEWFEQFDVAHQAFDINTLLTAPFSLEDLAEHIILSLAPQKKNRLIAYSTGGLVAIKIALLRPDLINQLVLINSTPKFIEADAWCGIKVKDAKRLTAKVAMLSLEDFMAHFTNIASHPKQVNARDYRSWWSDTTEENLMALMAIIVATDLRAELEQLKAEIVFINSAFDSLVPENPLPYSQLRLVDSTHLQIDQVELTLLVRSVLCH